MMAMMWLLCWWQSCLRSASPVWPDSGWPQLQGARPLSVSGPILMTISSGPSLPSVSPLTRDDPTHLPRCGDWPGWCQRWPLPPVSGLGLSWWGSGAGPHSWCHWPHHEYIREFLSETISVATDLRSHNECIEWSKNILEGLIWADKLDIVNYFANHCLLKCNIASVYHKI